MSFEVEQTMVDNREIYRSLKQRAGNLTAQLTAWQGEYTALRANVTPDKQVELDTKRNQFITALRNAMGI